MEVILMRYTQDAEELLLFSKYARLSPNADEALDIIRNWSDERKAQELDYISKTIESSWEFVNYVFYVSGVSRALTHQLVRTRSQTINGHDVSFAQQSQRTVKLDHLDTVMPKSVEANEKASIIWSGTLTEILEAQNKLEELGIPTQDRRGLNPTNIKTQILVKFDLRTFAHMLEERLCTRAQGEIQEMAKLMMEEVIKVHPWAKPFLGCYCCKKGTCRFMNYKECPIKAMQFDPRTGRTYDWRDGVPGNNIDTREDFDRPANLDEIRRGWIEMQRRGGFEAIPQMQKQ
jgi:thymidylate synthase (FAD)